MVFPKIISKVTLEYMPKNPYISIVVPIYNAQDYLQECIKSVLYNQTLTNIEVILVNDGSTDKSGDIIDEYKKLDNRVITYHQSNQGVAAARNKGLELSKGEYILFLDNDDWIEKNCLIELFKTATNYKADMTVGKALFYYSPDKQLPRYNHIPHQLKGIVLDGKQCFIEMMKYFSFAPMVYNYLYRNEWLKTINAHFFDVMHEDELWTLTALCQAERAVITDICFYYYRQRNNSIMSSISKKERSMTIRRINSLFTLSEELIRFGARVDFNNNIELKSWIYVKIAELTYYAFEALAMIEFCIEIPPSFALAPIIEARKWIFDVPKGVYMCHCNRIVQILSSYKKQLMII